MVIAGVLVFAAGCISQNGTSEKTPANANKSSADVELLDESEPEVDLVTEDAYGKDLEQTERYPGSIRSYYEAYDDEISVIYQTVDDQEKIRAYYNELLPKSGWELDGESSDYMEYIRTNEAGEDEYLTLYLYEYTNPVITEYELDYEPPFNEEDDSAADEDMIDVELE